MTLLSKLPLSWLQQLGRFAGLLVNSFPNEFRRISRINIGLCFPDLSSQAQHRLTKQSLRESGKTLFEMPAFWLCSAEKTLRHLVRVEGEALVKRAFQQGKGLILLCPHLGAWELINLYLAEHYPLIVLYKPTKMAYFQKLMHKARQRYGSTLVPTDRQGVKALYQGLAKGKAIMILPDQNPGKNGSEYAHFFGQPTLTMTLVNRLTQKNQPPIFFIYAERLPGSQGYVIHFSSADPAVGDPDPLISAAALNHGLEACIREIPHQYLWAYKRFKQPPAGSHSIY